MYSMKSKTKQSCGVLLFYHINKCGGGTMRRWFQQYHYEWQYMYGTLVHNQNQTQELWRKFIPEIDKQVDEVGDDRWSSISLHHGMPGIHYIQDHLSRWRATLEDKGCELVQ